MPRPGSTSGTVMRTILDRGPLARSTVARLTGLSPATVTAATGQLLDRGLLEILPEVAGPHRLGRPHVPVDIDATRHVVCGIHLAVTHVSIALLDVRGKVLAHKRSAHRTGAPDEVLPIAADAVRSLISEYGSGRAPLGIGFAAGGWVDCEKGTVVEHPLPGWNGYEVQRDLEARTGYSVRIDSHARALIEAECLYGHQRARNSVVQLFVGNCIDSAFAADGLVHRGRGAAAGAIAHLPIDGSDAHCPCGRVGCFQATLSDSALLDRAVSESIVPRADFDLLEQSARQGEHRARALFVSRAHAVGTVAAQLIDILDPDILVLCDRGIAAAPDYLDAIRDGVRSRSRTCRDPSKTVVASTFSGQALPIAAGAVVLGDLYRHPLTDASDPEHIVRINSAGRNIDRCG